MDQPAPVIHSYHEYTQHLEEALSFVRCLLHLSRKHQYLVGLDEQMKRCWNTSVNANLPDAEDRKACAQSIGAMRAELLNGPIMPVMRAMVPLLQHCQSYFMGLPLPAGSTPVLPIACTVQLCRHENAPDAVFCARCGAKLPQAPKPVSSGGWQLPSAMDHGKEIIADLTVCIDDCNCLKRLAPEDELFKFIDDQVQKMARFTRKSILPSPAERAELRLDRLSTDDMEAHVGAMFESAVQRLHGFSQLYVGFPTRM
jgi:hypothetical protein